MKIIGLDVGEKRIGVARADSGVRIAAPVGFIEVDGTEWEQLGRLSRLNNTTLFVLGLPRSNEGNETRQSHFVRQFARELAKKIPGAKIRFQDESLTSVVAEERLKKRKKSYQRGDIDAEAATIILQDFLESIGSNAKASDYASSPTDYETSSPKKLEQSESAKGRGSRKKVSNKSWIIPGVIALVILLGVAGLFIFKELRAREREAYYAKLESEMQPATFNFTIRPGETIYDVKRNLLALDRTGGREQAEPIPNYTETEVEAALSAKYDFEFLAGRPEGASLEGYLYPETHNFYSSSSVEDIFRVFLAEMERVIEENDLARRFEEQGLSLFEGITLASLVQNEATPGEEATVAQVFLSRLRYGWSLGSDATVSYALDVLNPDRDPHDDNQSALVVDSCYNTRLYAGLPCGPISNPGLPSLLAVAEPSDTSYLYFLTGDDGLMYYSYTESEHFYNRTVHCQTMCNISL